MRLKVAITAAFLLAVFAGATVAAGPGSGRGLAGGLTSLAQKVLGLQLTSVDHGVRLTAVEVDITTLTSDVDTDIDRLNTHISEDDAFNSDVEIELVALNLRGDGLQTQISSTAAHVEEVW